jgi:very-long-chain (3R)-3-hydroxyacyl-CoA dehydratase
MVFAWSLTEVIRYSFYAISLVDQPPSFLLYLRYTTFYILYPLGASSEAFLNYSTLPASGLFKITPENWALPDYIRAFLFVIWWPGASLTCSLTSCGIHEERIFAAPLPGLFVMFTHMVKQRAKIIGGRGKKYRKE